MPEQPENPARRATARPFFIALILSLCVAGAILGCLAVDGNTRRTVDGVADFGITYTVTDGLPVPEDRSGQPLFSLPEENAPPLNLLLGAPTRLAVRLLRLEGDAVAEFFHIQYEKREKAPSATGQTGADGL